MGPDDDPDPTRAGILKGKMRYFPPEQLTGDKSIDRRADIFAVGVMLWEALAGKRMWANRSDAEIVEPLLSGRLPSLREACPSISPHCEAVVTRALAKKREERYESALEMLIDLEGCMAELGPPVQQRDLASFLTREFGEVRSKLQKAVAEARSGRGTHIRRLYTEFDSSSGHLPSLGSTTGVTGAASAGANRRRWVLPVLVLLLGMLVGLVLLGRRILALRAPPPSGVATASPASTASARLVRLEVSVVPAEAQIWLDGRLLDRNPWKGTREAAPVVVNLEARMPGFVPVVRPVSLNQDIVVDLRLEPVPVRDANPQPVVQSRPPRDIHVRSRSPDAAAAPSARPAVRPNCDPPYTLSEDGVKTFKPECF